MLEWKNFRPLGKWMTVKADPRVKKTRGGIHLTDKLTKVEAVMEGTGVILRCGKEAAKDISPGDRICFRGFLKDVFGEFIRDDDDCPIFALRVEDVLMVIPPDTQMGAFSGPRSPANG